MVNGPGVASASGCYPWEHVRCVNGSLACADCLGVVVRSAGGFQVHSFEGCEVGKFRMPCKSYCVFPNDDVYANGPCMTCTNAKTNHSHYTTEGTAGSADGGGGCSWDCDDGFVRRNRTGLIGGMCVRFLGEQCLPSGTPEPAGCNSSAWTATVVHADGLYLLQC
jgi:hypothetical protein